MSRLRCIAFSAMLMLPSGAAFAQQPSVLQLTRFPEDFLGKTVTFKNIWWYPVLHNVRDTKTRIEYFSIQLDVSEGDGDRSFSSTGAMSKVGSVVGRKIAKQLAADHKGGYEYNYLGDIAGYIVKAHTFGNEYFFVITKIVHHETDGTLIKVYQ